MTTAAIFDKYATALVEIGADTLKLSGDAVMLALRLAIGDAYNAGAALCDDLAAIVASQAQADAEVRELRQQLAQLDADNAGLIAEVDRLNRQNVIATATATSAAHVNGNGANPTPAAQSEDWGRNHPAWQALPAVDLAVIEQLANGLVKFRSLSKTLRRDMVLRAIRHLASERNGTISGGDWDRYRPLWMPTTGAVMMLSTDGRWPSLLAMAMEPAKA